MAAKRTGGSGRPSMFEVAKRAGVSHQTVSRVINHSPDVSESTRAKVQKAIDELGYRPSNSARALASSRSRTIGLIAGGLHFFGPFSTIAAIESVARSHGLFMSVMMLQDAVCTQDDFDELCGMLNEQNVDAFMFLTPTDGMFSVACRAKVAKPRILLTSTHGALDARKGMALVEPQRRAATAMVGIDQWGAMAEVVRLLGQYGHRRTLYFAGPSEWRDARTRLDAWVKLTRNESIGSVTIQCRSWESSEAYARMNHVLERIGHSGGVLPTAVVTANDGQAVGVARALREHGLSIPQDVSVVGFDDMPAVDNMFPPLTTVRPDFGRLGTMAMRELLWLLGEGDEVVFPVSAHGAGLVDAQVVLRSSLGPASRR